MFTHLLSLFMLLLLAGSTFGGVPMHTPEQGACPVADGMEQMDCCLKAQQGVPSPEVSSAKLCCALDCQGGGGPVSPSGTTSLSIRVLPASQPGGVAAVSALPIPAFLAVNSIEPPISSNDDHPTYIRHLSLLI
jgi:hypothetical protein